ncbi:uncharacterized protein LOC130740376 isoform X2 [Lotus japonicus]|nr:uncharacterized protein LOC130740376 isoform X2 [Lotus japonicus]
MLKWRNLMPEIIPIEGNHDLVVLYMNYFLQLECLIDTTSIDAQVLNVLPKLVELALEEMDNLKELCNGPFPSDFLQRLEWLFIRKCKYLQGILFKSRLNLCNLKTLELYTCSTLESLFQLSTCRSLVLLETLSILDCEQLKNIITCERTEEEWGDEIVDYKNHCSMFPNLKYLCIIDCPQLQVILPLISTLGAQLLEKIHISDCEELKYIFGQCQHEHKCKSLHQEVKDGVLGSLKSIQLIKLPNFIDIFPVCDNPPVKRSSTRDISTSQIQPKPIKCNIFPWKYSHKPRIATRTEISLDSEDKPQDCSISLGSSLYDFHLWQHAQPLFRHSQNLCNITEINVCNVSKIKSIFIVSIARAMLLEKLSIKECDELKHIIIGIDDCGDVFPKLKDLEVRDCENLEYIFGHYSLDNQNREDINLHLPSLRRFIAEKLFNFIGICSENYWITLPPLTLFELIECPKYSKKSIGDFFDRLDSRHIKDWREYEKHFLTLEFLRVLGNSKVENIFFLDEMIRQPVRLGVLTINLSNLPHMTCLYVGPKNSFILQNLETITIVQCEKLETIFSRDGREARTHGHPTRPDPISWVKTRVKWVRVRVRVLPDHFRVRVWVWPNPHPNPTRTRICISET